jgi:hypothetical protein
MDQEPFPMRAIGLPNIKREDLQKRLENPGPLSMNLLRNILHHHMRLSHNPSYRTLWTLRAINLSPHVL